jgi:uncharacterized protein (TIGR02246 family)
MKTLSIFVCLYLLAASASADTNADAKAHSDAFSRAMEAGDVAAVMALYADDAYLIWPGAGQEAHGKAAIEKLVTSFIKDSQGAPLVVKSQDVVDLGSGLFAVIGQWEQVVTGPDGTSQTIVIRTSEVVRKVGAKTFYVVDHASVGLPAPTATAMATATH